MRRFDSNNPVYGIRGLCGLCGLCGLFVVVLSVAACTVEDTEIVPPDGMARPVADSGISPQADSGPSPRATDSSTPRSELGPSPCVPACQQRNCGSDGCGGSCGSCPERYSCSDFYECVETCVRKCGVGSCGDDGCGGSCGSCSENETCKGGQCRPAYPHCRADSSCTPPERCWLTDPGKGVCRIDCDLTQPDKDCPAGTFCSGLEVSPYQQHFAWASCRPNTGKKEAAACVAGECGKGLACVRDRCVAPCAKNRSCPLASQRCIPVFFGEIDSDASVCWPPVDACSHNPCTDPNSICTVGARDEAICSCKTGYEDRDGQCVKICVPDCFGKTCGGNGCGGTCGSCIGDAQCLTNGTCCTASCDGKTCGDDGCGGSCGQCAGYTVCSPKQECCSPSCAGRQCGDDGCGGSCGRCTSPKRCDTSFTCSCTPSCAGKECGGDGCGGTCGRCISPLSCDWRGSCVREPKPPTISLLIFDSILQRGRAGNGSVTVEDPDGLDSFDVELKISGPASTGTKVSFDASPTVKKVRASFSLTIDSFSPKGRYTLTVTAVDDTGKRSNALRHSFTVY